MKRAILFIIIGAALGGGVVWLWQHPETDEKKPAAEKSAGAEAEAVGVSRDDDGNAVITMNHKLQGSAGIVTTNPEAAQLAREIKGYGSVLDPAPLGALLMELASARAAYIASSNELARLNILSGQGNASPRALQTAEAAALRDQLAVQSAKDRLALTWGAAIANQPDLTSFVESLTAHENVLVRIDLAAGEDLKESPTGARLVALSGDSVEAKFLGFASAVDPQTQSRGFIFLAKTKGPQLLPGEAVTGFLKFPGEPLSGVILPRAAIVRTEGKGWVYVLGKSGETFTRKEIPLEHATDAGWFVTNGISASDQVVVTGAQTLLSVELKPASSAPAD